MTDGHETCERDRGMGQTGTNLATFCAPLSPAYRTAVTLTGDTCHTSRPEGGYMKKNLKTATRLQLTTETIRMLGQSEFARVAGGLRQQTQLATTCTVGTCTCGSCEMTCAACA